jgi:hypothetical protein
MLQNNPNPHPGGTDCTGNLFFAELVISQRREALSVKRGSVLDVKRWDGGRSLV